MSADPTHLTRRYVIALLAVALLSLVGQLLVQRALTRHAEDARVINIAGRQRMLSQCLTKTALALARAPADAQAEHRAELAADSREWTRAHRIGAVELEGIAALSERALGVASGMRAVCALHR